MSHLEELAIALDTTDKRRFVPLDIPEDASVLDIGCGVGQTLIASCRDQLSVGIDIDFSALSLGKTLTDRVQFVCGAAESLPFRHDSFEYVIARVSLPYTNIPESISEIRRVLRPHGQLWALFERPWLPLRIGLYKRPRFYFLLPYLALNTLTFNMFGFSFPFIDGKYRGYQTAWGVQRCLRNAGFESISITKRLHLIATARKRSND